jgi:hypothetical protein
MAVTAVSLPTVSRTVAECAGSSHTWILLRGVDRTEFQTVNIDVAITVGADLDGARTTAGG